MKRPRNVINFVTPVHREAARGRRAAATLTYSSTVRETLSFFMPFPNFYYLFPVHFFSISAVGGRGRGVKVLHYLMAAGRLRARKLETSAMQHRHATFKDTLVARAEAVHRASPKGPPLLLRRTRRDTEQRGRRRARMHAAFPRDATSSSAPYSSAPSWAECR